MSDLLLECRVPGGLLLYQQILPDFACPAQQVSQNPPPPRALPQLPSLPPTAPLTGRRIAHPSQILYHNFPHACSSFHSSQRLELYMKAEIRSVSCIVHHLPDLTVE